MSLIPVHLLVVKQRWIIPTIEEFQPDSQALLWPHKVFYGCLYHSWRIIPEKVFWCWVAIWAHAYHLYCKFAIWVALKPQRNHFYFYDNHVNIELQGPMTSCTSGWSISMYSQRKVYMIYIAYTKHSRGNWCHLASFCYALAHRHSYSWHDRGDNFQSHFRQLLVLGCQAIGCWISFGILIFLIKNGLYNRCCACTEKAVRNDWLAYILCVYISWVSAMS